LRLGGQFIESIVGVQTGQWVVLPQTEPRPVWWAQLWERYVETKLDYRVEATVLRQKMTVAGGRRGSGVSVD
jgi:hypothetical protein